MEEGTIEISSSGKQIWVPCVTIDGRHVIITGKWCRMAVIKGEQWLEDEPVRDPELFVSTLKTSAFKPDIFAFSQRMYEIRPKHSYYMEWDNLAAIPITTFEEWWEKRVSRKLRQDITRGARLGLTVAEAEYDDALAKGIWETYNETPIRSGRRYWHYGKDFETVKRENATHLDRSQFLVARCGEEFVGFMKIVHAGRIAHILQIVAKQKHHDKRPLNALIAKAVELCHQRGSAYFTYGRYTYGSNKTSSIREFKHRNGFVEIRFPRYYIPLTLKGRMILGSRLHLGWRRLVPHQLYGLLVNARAMYLEKTALKSKTGASANLAADTVKTSLDEPSET
jgi:hypothetical protein